MLRDLFDFSGTGRAYGQFPDRQHFRVFLEDLREEAVRQRLAAIWTAPKTLDPARESARVTHEIAKRLAAVSKALETSHPPEEVAHFLMRCIFTMFAEDVALLPKGRFTQLLADCRDNPDAFAPLLDELWSKMDEPRRERRFYSAFATHLRHFNGNLFKGARAFPLGREEIGELHAAALSEWTEVDPAIFGTLLEQALDRAERKKLGAHYTPRAYVQRLVEATVMEPLRADWQAALARVESAKDSGDPATAIAHARAFHRSLCATRVLDPVCGTGNFLYVALELMKRLEGEVLETLAELGEPESMGLERETVDPHQFLGLELNPRAAAIAELVVWIGYLQQHYRTRTGHPAEPILRAFHNINFGRREGYDAVLTWDGYPLPTIVERDGKRVETFPNARRPDWPEAEFIVGNPPFIGKGATMRAALGDAYVDALQKANKRVASSADFVMQWWDRAAQVLVRVNSACRRFGLVTTNSNTQSFSRRVTQYHLRRKDRLSIIYAIPDHPWTKMSRDAAAVRIAMTVTEAGDKVGRLIKVMSETDLETDLPKIELAEEAGPIHSDLTIGADATSVRTLSANQGLSCNGVMLAGGGFVVDRATADRLTVSDTIENSINGKAIFQYIGGSELTQYRNNDFVIDFFGLSEIEARRRFPSAYQHLIESVKPTRDINPDKGFRENWSLFGRTRPEIRLANQNLSRYIATTRTSKHRFFQFVDREIISNHEIVVISSDEASILAVLSSKIHLIWALRAGGWLGVGNDPRWNKTLTFDPFAFPDPDEALRQKLRDAGEELDATRKTVQAEHPDLTLTGLYNVLEKIRAGTPLDAKDEDVKQRGRVLILKELHETIDRLTFDAYGWPHDLTDEEILERLVALNAERAAEEAQGHVRWLRPDYQIPRFAKGAGAKTGKLDLGETVVAIDKGLPDFPTDRDEQQLAVEQALAASGRPMSAAELARGFKKTRRKIEPQIERALGTLARYGRAIPIEGRYLARRAA